MRKSIQGICILILTLLIGLSPVLAFAANPATETTARLNAAWVDTLDFDDESEKENALRGLIEAPESLVILDDAGKEVWNVADYAFVNELEAVPDTVNPSLFRNTLYNSYAGLFEVCDGIYQVRGYDMANATFIRTDNGWIVFDVLMCREDMAAAKALMEKHFGGLWEATAGGSAIKGETPPDCAKRELFEETGIRADHLTKIGHVVHEAHRSYYVLFLCVTDCEKDSVVLQRGETDAFRWVSEKELLNMTPDELCTTRMLQMNEKWKIGD